MGESLSDRSKKNFFKIFTYDIVKNLIIVFLTLAITTFGANVLVHLIGALAPFKWHIVVTLGILGVFLCLKYVIKFDRYRPNFPRMDFDYRLLEKEISFVYIDREHIKYSRKFRIRASKNGIDNFKDKYFWTGDHILSLNSGIPEQDVVRTYRKNIFQYYEIRFQKTLKKGEIINSEVIWELDDTGHNAVPFFSATIEHPTENLIFNFSTHPDSAVKEVTCEISSSIGAGKPFSSFIKPLDKHNEVTWRIQNPKLLYHYEMKWVVK